MVATVQESGDQFLFGADDEEEESSRNFGEDKDQLISQFWDDADVENAPVVSDDQLIELDEAAFQQEITRLQEMKVLRKCKRSDLSDDFAELSTTAVQDWRHRSGSWQRRSRLVAREYKWSEVPQRTKVFVRPPKGYEHLLEEDEVWVLERLLPGQRAGTKEWSLFLKEVVEKEGYETFLLSPNLYVKKDGKGEVEGAILVHVDDIQLAATPQEGKRLKAKLEARFSLTTQGPCGPGGTEEAVHFLKRKYECDESGTTITMGAKYIEKLVKLLGLQNKKSRATPEAAHEDENATELEGDRRSNYATAVGMLLYISCDRPDAQHCIRELASCLVKPTEKQLIALENGQGSLESYAVSSEEDLERLKSKVRALERAVQRLASESQGPVMVVRTNIPGLREDIIRQTQERGIELSVRGDSERDEHEPPSDHDSEWYPGRSEDEAFGDNAQWMDEYRHIQAYEREHGPLVSPRAGPQNEEEPAAEEEPMRAGHVNVTEDEVEKALITFSMLRSCEELDSEEATALEGLKLTENALSTAQKALDDTKAKLKAKRGTLPSLKNSRPRGEVELERLEQQLQSAQVKLKPLRTARQDWDQQRRNRKLVEEVEQQIILAEVEMDRVEVILKSQDTESVTAACVAEVQAAVKLSADAQKTMMMHFSSRKVQNSGSKHLEALAARVDSVQARHITAEANLQNMEDRLSTDGFLAEVKAKLEAIKRDVDKLQELLQNDQQDDLTTVKAAEELNVKIQQSFPVTKVFLSMKIVEVKRLTTEAGVAALVHLQECEEQLEMSREAFEKQCNLIGEKRAKAHLEEAAAEVLVAEQKAAELKEASRVWAETDLVAEELKEATEKSLRLEREVNKALAEARKVIACRQIEAKNKNTPHSFVVSLEQLQNRLVQVQSEVGNQRKLYAIVEQRMKGRKMQQEIEQKLQPLEEGLRAAEKMAEKHEMLLSEESANFKELMKELKNAELKTQDLQLSLKPLARLIESAKVDGSRLQEMQERFQSTLTKLKQHSEACFIQDLLRDAKARFATAKASAEEVERGAPSKSTDPVEAAAALNKWEKSIQTVMLSISSNRSEMSLKRLGIQRLKSDGAVQAVEALNGTISEMEGLNKRLTAVRSKAAEALWKMGTYGR
eukprot:s441_g23.t1